MSLGWPLWRSCLGSVPSTARIRTRSPRIQTSRYDGRRATTACMYRVTYPFRQASEIVALERQLMQCMSVMMSKQKKLALCRWRARSLPVKSGTPSTTGLLSRLWPGRRTEQQQAEDEIRHLKAEIARSDALRLQLFNEVHELHLARERLAFSRTCLGKYYTLLGYIMSGYCVYKFFMSSVNVIFQRKQGKDPISRGLEIVCQQVLNLQVDLRFWSQHISFMFIGILVFTQVRSFLLQLTRVFSASSSDLTSNIFILMLAEIMGFYFVSSVLLMRVNLPLEYRQIITDVLGNLEFDLFHAWFDAIFIVAAAVTILWLTFQRRRSVKLFTD